MTCAECDTQTGRFCSHCGECLCPGAAELLRYLENMHSRSMKEQSDYIASEELWKAEHPERDAWRERKVVAMRQKKMKMVHKWRDWRDWVKKHLDAGAKP